jgi:hypothetical protein
MLIQSTIAGRHFEFDAESVKAAVAQTLPEPIRDHYVIVAGRRFPPKQVISLATGLDRADFTTHQARRILRRLGFTVARRSTPPPASADAPRPLPQGGREAEILRPYMGKWVAQRRLEVLVAADTPQEVLAWLERHDQYADAMFRVPEDPARVQGFAPL